MTESMFNQLSTTERFAAAVSACVLATLALLICLRLEFAPSYADFIVGRIAWNAGAKLQDLIAAPVFISVLFFSFIYITSID